MKPLPVEGYTALYFTTATIHPLVLEQFKSERKDRDHQFFKDPGHYQLRCSLKKWSGRK